MRWGLFQNVFDKEDYNIKNGKLYGNYLMFSVDINLKTFYLQMLIFKPLLTTKDC